ncbi:CSN-associated deubiquitinating enzyme Ubp12 [Physocladia obscura]|uniref:ubiquitinyl hydrolase 1 n=1 Tax=Physocladia obscura TaxID=109957 RepID=A0AAD5STU8_9FUNG|nr:CSN-associated deubiquitinating enzyme Ubp12 [Physocladia obscura]
MFLSLPVPERREITVNLIVVGSCFRRKSSQNSELKTNLSSITENLVIDESPSLSKTFSTDSLPIPTDLHSILAYERPKRITITVPRDATIQILKLKVAEKMGWTLGKIPGLSATRRLIVSEIYNNKIFKSFTDWDRVSEMQKNDVVYVYELTDPPYNDLGIVVPASVALKSTFVPVYLRINNMRENSYGNDINNLIGVPILIPVPAEFGSAVSVPAEIAEHVSDYLWSELAFNQLGAPLYELVVASLRRYSKIPLYQDVRVDAVSGNDLVDLYSSNYKNPTWTPGPPPPAAEPLSPFSDIDNEPYGPQLTRDSAPVVSEEQPRKLDARSGSLFENLQPLDESEATTSVKDLFTLKYFLGETNLAPMDIKDRFYQNPNTYRAKKGQFGSDGSVDSNIFTRPKLSQKQAQTFEFKNGVPEEQTAETDDDDSEDNVEYLIASKSENTHTLKFNGWKLNQRARDGFVVYPVALEDGGKGKDGADVPHMETINMNSELVIVAEFSLEAAAMLFGDEILERGVTTLEVFEPDRDSANSTDFDTRRDSAGGENVSKIIALDDCLKEFMREEIMGDDDTWYCPKCKEHKKIKKKLDIWSVPDTLVLHLKRFSQTGRGFRSMSSNKIDALVDFPVNNLDLSEFVIGRDWMKQQESTHVDGNEENGDNGRLIYDLFGVSNHYGGMGGGHYTAFAKNPIDQEWYNFDDSSVTKTSESNVVTSAAYMLFYQRRSKKSSHNLEEMIELRKNSAPESSITKKVTPYSVYQSSSSSTDLSSMNWRPEYSSTVPIGFSKISSFRPIMPVSPSTSEAGHSDDENRIKLAVPVATLDNPAGWEFGSHKKYEALESSSPVHEIHLDGDDDYDGLPSLENAKEADEDMDMFNLSYMNQIPISQGKPTTRYNPHSNRGRKKSATVSVEGRRQQICDSQRALRARKQDYMLDLEKKVANLIHENVLLKQQVQLLSIAIPSTTAEVPCFNQNCAAIIQALQMQVVELQSSLSNATPLSHNSSSLGQNSSLDLDTYFGLDNCGVSDWIIDSAHEIDSLESKSRRRIWPNCEELYGPVEVESFKSKIKAMEPFRYRPKVVDRTFDLYLRTSKATETRTARSLMLKIIRETLRLLDRCGIVERVQVIETIAEYRLKYTKHIRYWREMCAFSEHEPKRNQLLRENITPRVIAFRDALKSIPSLVEYHGMIDDMCDFWVAEYEYDPQEFFHLVYMVNSLAIACEDIKDSTKFWLSFFIVRQSRHNQMDELIAEAEAVTI